MSNPSVIAFLRGVLNSDCVTGKSVLEVGSYDWQQQTNIRELVEPLHPGSYVGVDIESGPGVDVVANALGLTDHFGESLFDLVVSTEMIEHVENWRRAVSQLKRVLAPGGTLIVTTRSRGFHLHAYPCDYWRYEPDDFEAIFSDLTQLVVATDPLSPGVFAAGVKPANFNEVDLAPLKMYSVAFRRRTFGTTPWINHIGWTITKQTIASREIVRRVLPESTVRRLQQLAGH